ncbi:bifunctional adenosylcobinamide kinase/adenosylcobinamide-phosphate guanylyltransferase [Novosphingobium sp. G106]|uniref:bifunctional adenosylcobinamide kinase/adenosylcobinamide-phosphate guanylyltransferase n=1 Tax=Novosphingobium sp. G106 TaxID=2849500 RepID=UPI001C2D7662|nr:bifunctional adenosylcobinamide kinase/adenosylcobinamide-phosphate guanylyltransferase [Novosphingobium sp. G106]MBV1687450.1 bifunctional adenosylcobinamide kinase/adenosylcobinamide-phosphate guanylyltransferase [Novosphingobium sp. G106]
MKSSLLVLGGARSGKSAYAQARAEALHGGLIYIATAQAFDAEMVDRIARHRADRGARWATVEEPLDLPAAIEANSRTNSVVLVDCLTLWASNLLLAEHDLAAAMQALTKAVTGRQGAVILVANEVGLGIVPDNALARQFRDYAGSINQAVAAVADEVVMMFAGLPMTIKPAPSPVHQR